MKTSPLAAKKPIFSTGLLITIAIGASLAMLPSVVGLILLIIGETFYRHDFLLPFLIQGGGALIMLIACIIAYNKAKKYEIGKAGIILMMVASFLGLAANVFFGLFISDHAGWSISLTHNCQFGIAVLIIAFLCLCPLMAVGSFLLGKNFTRFKGWGVAFTVLTVITSAYYVLWGLSDHAREATTMENMNRRGYYEVKFYDGYGVYETEIIPYSRYYKDEWNRGYYDDEYNVEKVKMLNRGMAITSFIVLGLTLLYGVFAAWRLIGATPKRQLNLLGQDNMQNDAYTAAVAAGVTDHSQYMPKGTIPVPASAGQVAGSVAASASAAANSASQPDDDIVAQLMRLDDAALKEIVDRPAFYNPAVVAKAAELLDRRQAWEKINNLGDEELLAMTMAAPGQYPANIVEAASMELYSRDSRLLRQQFLALTPDVVASIANGTAPAPEGIRLAASAFLNKNTQP